MMRVLFLCLWSAVAYAQLSVTVAGTSATQAILHLRGYSGACTITLREGSPAGAIHPDANGTVDTSRTGAWGTITRADGTRIVTLGQRRSNLALATDTEYYGTISGCGTASFRFRTTTPQLGNTMPEPLPWDCSKTFCADVPQIDWDSATHSRAAWLIDPITGVQGKPYIAPGDFGRSYHDTDEAFTYWAGGSGWTSPANAAAGSTSSFAAVGNTNPLHLYVNRWFAYNEAVHSLENIGVLVWGSATGATADDRTVDICITKDPAGMVCSGTSFPVVLPSGGASPSSVPFVTGGSSHPNAGGAYPTAYPDPFFAGWGDVYIRRDEWPQPDSLFSGPGTFDSVTSGLMAITIPTSLSHFQKSLIAGQHVFVSNATAQCTANGMPGMCTVGNMIHAGSLQLSENFSVGSGNFVAFPFGIMVRKRNATGTAHVGFRFKSSGTTTATTNTIPVRCSNLERTAGDGVKGYLCTTGGNMQGLYFISSDGNVVRRLAIPMSPEGFDGRSTFNAQNLSFSNSDPHVMFATDYGNTALFKLTYVGDYVTSVWDSENAEFWQKPGGDTPQSGATGTAICPSTTRCEDIVWSLAMPTPLNTQILASQWANFAQAPWADWTTGVSYAGVSGDMLVFYKLVSGRQNYGPCHIAVVNALTGNLIDVFSTFDPSNIALGWGVGCHSVLADDQIPNVVRLNHNLPSIPINEITKQEETRISTGPFRVTVLGVQRSGSMDTTNTALPWPPDATYDRACPSGLSTEFTAFGAVGNQCATLLIREPCNVKPHATDTTLYGVCPWNAAYSKGPGLYAGNSFYNPTLGGASPGDAEHLRIVQVTNHGNGTYTVVVQRNARRSYCCAPDPTATPTTAECLITDPPRLTHANGWYGELTAGTKGTCNASDQAYWYPDVTRASRQLLDLPRAYALHATYGRAPGGGYVFIANNEHRLFNSVSQLGEFPIVPRLDVAHPQFNGVPAPIGGGSVQSYPSMSQSAAPDELKTSSVDWNHMNDNLGSGADHLGTSLGPRTITNVTGDIWTVTPNFGAVDYKNRPLIGWAGPFNLKDVSGPGSNIATAANYTFCYAYAAGECYAGSTQGTIYVKAPKVYPSGQCHPAMNFAVTPCVVTAAPAMGWIRQLGSTVPDPNGKFQRKISSLLKPIGSAVSFTGPTIFPNGRLLLSSPGGWAAGGVRASPWLFKLPPFRRSNEARNTLGGLTIRIGARTGVTHARVRFGYNTSFHCTERSEACLTDASVAPYAFAQTDSLTGIACASGCTIEVPAVPGRLTYYRIETSGDGSTWNTTGDTEAAVP